MDEKIKFSRPVPPFVRYCAATIPTMFDDSLSYYEALCSLWKWLQSNLVEVVNNNAAVTQEYIRMVNELKEFVENYFENLDVQEEINNKLDEMAEDGTLQEIVGAYLNANAVWGFDNVADMKTSTNLIDGSFARTLGFYAKNDGGGATYKIRKVTNDDTVDDSFLIEIGDPANELVAELVYSNEVSILQLGAKKFDGTKHDIKPYVEKYLSKLADDKRFTLKIPFGLYHSGKIEITQAFSIVGDEGFGIHNIKQTVISSLNDNQEYILSIGNQTTLCRNFVLKNITFTTKDFEYSDGAYSDGSIKTIDNAVLLQNACFGITDNLFFDSINGNGLKISTSFEIYFKLLNFRNIDARNSASLIFGTKIDGVISSPNISACNFEKIMFEETLGDLILMESACRFLNNHIGVINFEDHAITRTGISQTTFTNENIPAYEASNHESWSVIAFAQGGELRGTTIDSLDINNLSARFTTVDSTNYAYDKIININGDYGYPNFSITSLNIVGMNKDSIVLYSHGEVYYPSAFKLGLVTNESAHNLSYDLDNFTRIENQSKLHCASNTFIPVVEGSVIPAYKLVPQRTSGAMRPLKSDSGANNETKVCVALRGSVVGCVWTLQRPAITIRAKIPNGTTPTIALSGTRYATTQLTGTGDWNIYQLTMHANSAIGNTAQLALSGATEDDEVLIDWIA